MTSERRNTACVSLRKVEKMKENSDGFGGKETWKRDFSSNEVMCAWLSANGFRFLFIFYFFHLITTTLYMNEISPTLHVRNPCLREIK